MLAHVFQEGVLQTPVEGEIVEIQIACARFKFDPLRLVAGMEKDSFTRYAALENQRSVVDDPHISFSDAGFPGQCRADVQHQSQPLARRCVCVAYECDIYVAGGRHLFTRGRAMKVRQLYRQILHDLRQILAQDIN